MRVSRCWPQVAPARILRGADVILGAVGDIGDMLGEGEPGVESYTQHPGGFVEREIRVVGVRGESGDGRLRGGEQQAPLLHPGHNV